MFAGVSFPGKCANKAPSSTDAAAADTKAAGSTDAATDTKAPGSTDAAADATKPTKPDDKKCPKADCPKHKLDAGCAHVKDHSKNADGCPANPCGSIKCVTQPTTGSKCRINPDMAEPKHMNGGEEGHIQVASLIDTSNKENVEVTDIATQCPGDEFELTFPTKPTWTKFDSATGKASARAPKVDAVEEINGMVVKMTNGKVV